jgi:hypothetical protein
VYYDENKDALFAQAQEWKAQLKNAIDDEKMKFYIEANVVKKNNKTDIIILQKIEKKG